MQIVHLDEKIDDFGLNFVKIAMSNFFVMLL